MEDFYDADVDTSFILDQEFSADHVSKSDPTLFLKVSSVLFVRAGLFLSQVSSIPSSNIQILIFQNVIDIAVNTIIYCLIGYLFAFGKDVGSFIGIDGFLSDSSDKEEFAEGWMIVIAVSGLLVAAVGDRISFFASLILNTLISGFVFPIFIHWVLSDSGWLRVQTFLKVHVSFKDYNYSCLIHMSGGFLALISMLILNKRLLRFKDMDVCSIPDNGPSLTLFGNFCMILGFFGFGIPTQKYLLTHLNNNFYGIVMTNMLVSAFASVVTALILTFVCPWEPLHKWTSMRSIQAGISGIAVIAGGADLYHPVASLIAGLCNGILFFFISFLINISPVEDYSNIIACHFTSGFIGTLLPPVMGIRENFGTTAFNAFVHINWQFIGDMAILSVILVVFTPITFLMDYCSILRSWDEDINHRRALFASKTMKNQDKLQVISDQSNQETTVNYLEEGYKAKERTSQDESPEGIQEKVDILFEKKPFDSDLSKQVNGNLQSSSFEETFVTNNMVYQVMPVFQNEKGLVEYVVNSKPMTFFEEIATNSRETSHTVVKDRGDHLPKTSKFFDIKMIKGIKNISDSKLFQKFKDNWNAPKKRTAWSREHELRYGSVSNIWASTDVRISMETQV